MSPDLTRLPEYIDSALVTLVEQAMDRLRARAASLLPHTAGPLLQWFDGICLGSPVRYFMHPQAFPTLLLPWWLDGSIGGQPDLSFHGDLVYSSVCGYYAIRLIDDVMDEGSVSARQLLPMAGFLHIEFQSAYGRHFPAGSRFWEVFEGEWALSAEASTRDAEDVDVDWFRFCEVTARKVCAARIPMTAVCVRGGQSGIPKNWRFFFDHLSRWHQFSNDMGDWQRDRAAGRWTYFLSEGRRRDFGDDSLTWFTRQGFSWGLATLREWMVNMRNLLPGLGNSRVAEYLTRRDAELSEFAERVHPGLATITRVLEAFPAKDTLSGE
jgi:hypothetical protein